MTDNQEAESLVERAKIDLERLVVHTAMADVDVALECERSIKAALTLLEGGRDKDSSGFQPCGEASADAEVFAGQSAEPSAAEILRYAQATAAQAAALFGPPKGWTALDDVYGCLMQIDNALCGLQRKPCEHVWSSDTEEHPYWHCMNCGTPKVMDAAPLTTSTHPRIEGEGSSVARADMTPPSGASDGLSPSDGSGA